ncbi:helix-hairpin-helix domain-containing protein [Catellatospora aurea]|uniref:Helix-hairpin-helix domain-containing protein n=1 Tax=Catellatospora aurea TaxID=1337874 RepID=A0ABW2GTR8_9ACTN
MPSSRKPPPVEADLDRLHRVLAQSPSPARLPLAPPPWSDALDAPFLDVLPDFALSRTIPKTSPSDPSVLRDAHVYAAVPSGTAAPDADGLPTTDTPPSALPGRAAFDPGRRGLRALAVVAALVVAVAAYLAWQTRPSVEPAPEPVTVPVAESRRPAASTSAATLVVAVTGRVRKPGLVRLPPGARVADAIEAAGGVLPDTDLSAVNLARKVTDGELIAIGVPGMAGAEAPAAGAGPGAGPVNLNTATLAQLDALPGVGPVLAQRILDHRARHGDFRSVGDLRQVEGIGESKFAQLKDLVTV